MLIIISAVPIVPLVSRLLSYNKIFITLIGPAKTA